MMRKCCLVGLLLLGGALALVGCTSGSSSRSDPNTVGTGGGTVGGSQASVQVPPGALAAETTFSISAATSAPSGNLGTAYSFGPSGTTFTSDATVSLSYSGTDLGGAAETTLRLGTVIDNAWHPIANSTVDTNAQTVSGPVGHFSTYGIVVQGTNQSPTVVINQPANRSTVTEGQSVTFSASASDPEDGALSGNSVVWSVDGTPIGTGTSFSTSSLPAGNLLVVCVATDSNGAKHSDAVSLTVSSGGATSHTKVYIINGLGKTLSVIDVASNQITNNVLDTGNAPNHFVALDSTGYLVNSTSNNVQVIDLTTNQVTGTIDLPSGSNPWAIQFANNTKAYVSNLLTNTVSVVDAPSRTVVGSIPVGTAPEGMAFTNGKVYVCNTAFDFQNFTYGQGTVSVIDIATDQVVKTIDVGTNPQAAAIAPDGTVHVLCTGDFGSTPAQVYVIDANTDTVLGNPIDIGGAPGSLAMAPNGIAYLAGFGTGILAYDTSSRNVTHAAGSPITGSDNVTSVLVTNQGTLYGSAFSQDQVLVFNTSDESLVATLTAGDGPQAGGPRSLRR